MLLHNNEKQNKQKTENKHSWKGYIGYIFKFSYKNIHDKIIFFDAALLVQKNTMQAGYAERSIK